VYLSLIRFTLAGYSDGAVNVLAAACRLAASSGHHCVTPQHLLAGLATTEYGPSRTLLGRLGLDLRAGSAEVLELVGSAAACSPARRLDLGPEVRALLSRARSQARGMNSRYVGVEHLVLEVVSEPSVDRHKSKQAKLQPRY
jgi:ATP-dependent Clp protease ATP-binding subunit ClpA